MVNQILDTLYLLASAFGLFIIFKLAHAGIAILEAKTKNANVLLAEKFADQAVTLAEKTLLPGGEKQKLATDTLNARLQANGLSAHFTPEQIRQYIEAGVDYLKKQGLEVHVPKQAEIKEAV
ncbi:MAG: phage holin, LLH family [Oenococcus sp.]|uniref:phage holin, LLH family n=1 Tax=Oenococcus sp. TaxID=1979414 RepID=UPI0039EA95C7